MCIHIEIIIYEKFLHTNLGTKLLKLPSVYFMNQLVKLSGR